jgi:uncharacterized protein YfaS (alpha-2-macroglobulin family)
MQPYILQAKEKRIVDSLVKSNLNIEIGRLSQIPNKHESEFAISNYSCPLALLEPALVTDKNGEAQVTLHLPNALAHYRIMAVAAAGNDKFGLAESTITLSP